MANKSDKVRKNTREREGIPQKAPFPASTCEDGYKYVRGGMQVLAGTVARTCGKSGSVEKHGGRNSTKGVFTPSFHRKRLRWRLQTFAGKDANVCGEKRQCTARTVAVHCGSGCSALRLRWVKLVPKSPVLFWIREQGGEMHL